MNIILLTILIHFACILPLIGIAFWNTKKTDIKNIGLFFLLFTLSCFCLLIIPRPSLFSELNWNWWGKSLSIILGLSFIFFQPKEVYHELGFTTKFYPQSLKSVVIVFSIMCLLPTIQYVTNGFNVCDTETLLFQATLPGLDEELWFRGIMLYLLNQAFGKQWIIFGAKMGWGAFITILLFGLVHGLSLNKQMIIDFNAGSFIATSIVGFILTWGKEKCGSILPGIIAHNTFNFVQMFL
jgi:hypothetical protein